MALSPMVEAAVSRAMFRIEDSVRLSTMHHAETVSARKRHARDLAPLAKKRLRAAEVLGLALPQKLAAEEDVASCEREMEDEGLLFSCRVFAVVRAKKRRDVVLALERTISTSAREIQVAGNKLSTLGGAKNEGKDGGGLSSVRP